MNCTPTSTRDSVPARSRNSPAAAINRSATSWPAAESREVLRTLDPAWLRERYEDNHRSFADIAADLDIPLSDLARHARKLGLAIRHGVAAHNHILASYGAPEAFSTTIWTVFAARGAEQPIKRLLAIPGHFDLNQAAKHLGVRKAVPHPSSQPTRTRRRRHAPGHRACP
jgi:hypothetical protein